MLLRHNIQTMQHIINLLSMPLFVHQEEALSKSAMNILARISFFLNP